MDIATYAAAVGAAKRYTDEHSGSDDAVKYTEQDLTAAQQAQARENIGAAAAEELPTPEQEAAWSAQADWNEGSSSSASFIKNKPPLAKGGGRGGDMIGGTGVNQNSTRSSNSVAYGAFAGAITDHSLAFGNFAFAGTNYGGKHAVAIGNHVRAERDYVWAIGKYNQSNPDTAFAYGDGTSDSSLHNLMELKTDGTMLLNGNAVLVPEAVTGYDATKTQTLKNINGTLMWVDDT